MVGLSVSYFSSGNAMEDVLSVGCMKLKRSRTDRPFLFLLLLLIATDRIMCSVSLLMTDGGDQQMNHHHSSQLTRREEMKNNITEIQLSSCSPQYVKETCLTTSTGRNTWPGLFKGDCGMF